MQNLPQTRRAVYSRVNWNSILSGVMIGASTAAAILALSLIVPIVSSLDDGKAVLLAIGVAALLLPLRAKRQPRRSDRVYMMRLGPFVWRMYGDEETDRHFDTRREV